MADDGGDAEALRAERDLYRALLDLGEHEDVQPFLEEALALVVEVTAAQKGYLALSGPAGAPDASGASKGAGAKGTDAKSADAKHTAASATPRFWIARGMGDAEVSAARAQLSTGIIAEALRTGKTVATASAADDPRFRELRSVQAQKITAVLCAPIGAEAPMGVLYLQGRDAPGPFGPRDVKLAELFARRLAPLAHRVLARGGKTSERVDPTQEFRAKLKVQGLVGASRALAETLRAVAVAAPVDVTVLLTGESGTGKTEIARALHDNSRRASAPFVEINCAALPETLFEAELFGAEKGAHSTATRRIPGRIAAAQGGTLFLDEIGEIPLGAQAKLLQFLQSKRYHRLGGDAPVLADVRVVAATNADLEQSVREKRFREDLYYRLNVLSIRVPPLRERDGDVGILAEHFADVSGRAFGRTLALSPAARAALSNAEWPGNVRQLAATLQRGAAFALGEGVDSIEIRHLFPERADESQSAIASYQEATRKFQRRLLAETLEACSGNVSEAARRLDLARSHLHELLRAHGLSRPAAR